MAVNAKLVTAGTPGIAAAAAPVTIRSKEVKSGAVVFDSFDAYFDQSGYVVESERNGIKTQP